MQNTQNLFQSVIVLAVTSLLMLALPVIAALVWIKRARPSLTPLFLGAAGFMLFARVLELGVHMVCIVMDNPVSRVILSSTPLYVLYGALMAGIFEECGRYVFLRFTMKKHRNPRDYVMYGIGHGGIEVFVILTGIVSYLVIAVLLMLQGPEATEKMLDPTGAGDLGPTLETAAGFGPIMGLLSIVERLLAMSAHISLTLVVAYGLDTGRTRLYLPLAILAHALLDLLPAMYQRGAVSMLLCEGWVLLWAVLLAVWAVRLYKKLNTSPADS